MAPFLRTTGPRPLAPSTFAPTGLPTVLALHAAMLLSGSLLGCGAGAETPADGIEADRPVRAVKASSTITTITSPTTGTTEGSTPKPGTMASTFIDPDPHEVDGKRMLVIPPPLPTSTHSITTSPTTVPTWTGPKTAGAKPPVRPLPSSTPMPVAGRMKGPTPGATAGSIAPCPPPPTPGVTGT